MATRNLQLEKNAIDTFVKSYGKTPTTSNEWSVVHRLAYPTYSDLPDELRAATSEANYSIPVTDLVKNATVGPSSSPATNPNLTTQQRTQQLLGQYQTSSDEAKKQMTAAGQQQQQMTVGGGSFFSTLQNAIREKMGYQQAGIGQSNLFQQAGITGYDTLHQSLNARGTELDSSRADLQNVISGLGAQWKAQAQVVKDQYDHAAEQYKQAQDNMNSILDNLRSNEEQIKRIKLQHDLDLQTKQWEKNNPSAADQLKLQQAGYTYKNGQLTPDVSGATADQVAEAIKQVESGGNYNAKGASGEFGAYQFMPGTWAQWSEEYSKATGLNQSIPMTPENQDAVARWKIQQWMAQGMSADQVASMWNHGSPDYVGVVGDRKDKQGNLILDAQGNKIHYDTPAYVNKVLSTLSKTTGIAAGSQDVDFWAQQVLNGMPITQIPGYGNNSYRTQVMKSIAKMSAEQGVSVNLAQIGVAQKGKQVAYDQLSKNNAMIGAFESTAKANLQQFMDTLQNLQDTGSPVLNRYLRATQRDIQGDPQLVQFDTARTVAATEISKVLSSSSGTGVLSDSARQEAENLLKGDYTTEQLKAAAEILMKDMDNRKSANEAEMAAILNGDVTSSTGTGQTSVKLKDPKTGEVRSFTGLSDTDLADAKKQGYTVVQ